MKTLTSVEAQSHFGELLDTVQREPIIITRHGRVAAYMVSAQDMEELNRASSRRRNAVADFEELFAKSDSMLTPEAQTLTDEEVVSLVLKSR